jgi:hypothetical protein
VDSQVDIAHTALSQPTLPTQQHSEEQYQQQLKQPLTLWQWCSMLSRTGTLLTKGCCYCCYVAMLPLLWLLWLLSLHPSGAV